MLWGWGLLVWEVSPSLSPVGGGLRLDSHTCSPNSQEPSPYEESEVHDSFHQLIQEQSQRAAEEGLELQQVARTLGAPGEPRPGGCHDVGRTWGWVGSNPR